MDRELIASVLQWLTLFEWAMIALLFFRNCYSLHKRIRRQYDLLTSTDDGIMDEEDIPEVEREEIEEILKNRLAQSRWFLYIASAGLAVAALTAARWFFLLDTPPSISVTGVIAGQFIISVLYGIWRILRLNIALYKKLASTSEKG